MRIPAKAPRLRGDDGHYIILRLNSYKLFWNPKLQVDHLLCYHSLPIPVVPFLHI